MANKDTGRRRPRRGAPLAELSKQLQKLRNFHADPFAVFVSEALRLYGGAVKDPSPPDESQPIIQTAIEAYQRAVLEAPPFTDLLGPIYMEFMGSSKQQWGGMFYTPWTLSVATARMSRSDWKPQPKPDGSLWWMQEPACGCGSMVLAWLACIVEDFGPEALHLWGIAAVDKDLTASRACALQVVATLADQVWGIGEFHVLHGDSLRMEYYDCPWHSRLQPHVRLVRALLDALGPADTREAETPPPALTAPLALPVSPPQLRSQPHGQLSIFGEAA